MTTNLTLEQIQSVRERAALLLGVERRRYLVGLRDGIELASEPETTGTLAGGKEIQEFYDYLDTEGAAISPLEDKKV